MTMRAAIYARYSSEHQREASIEDQVRVCKDRIDRENWSLTATYTDHAMSGATNLRPGYQKLLEDARGKQFDVVIAEALDRLSRDQEHTAALYKQFGFCGVLLITLAEGEITELHVGLKGTMNALFLKDLALKTRRGLEGRIRSGLSAGGLSYGYDVIHEMIGPGQVTRGKRRINEAQAKIVGRIFSEYAAGQSPRSIAKRLNVEGVPAPGGAAWGPSTINGNRKRGTGILNNELYIGRLVWNRLQFVKDPATGKRVPRHNPERAWAIRSVPELRIVNESLWDRVRARQSSLRPPATPTATGNQFWDRRKPRYLLSGLIKCGECGGGYSKRSVNLFGCSNARNKGNCRNRLNIRRDVLEASLLAGLRERLMDPDLFKEFAEEFYREINRLRATIVSKFEASRAELEQIDRKLRRIIDAITSGVDARILQAELRSLESRQAELQALLTSTNDPGPLLHPNLAEVYRKKVAKLINELNEESIRPEATEILRSLIDAVVLVPENGRLRIDLKGDLAGILTFAAGSRSAASARTAGLELEQIKLVAGEGFEPPTKGL